MAYEELFKKIKDYESKWGKLGAGNSILNPEKTTMSHSGINNSNDFYGGKRKMLNMTNDYYEFRRKVAEGKKNNKLAHAAIVDIDEINRQHWERINTDGTLIHVGGRYVPNYEDYDEYLEHAGKNGPASGTNKYYAKIDKFYPDGKTRYFYSKEEWDAYSKNKGYSQNADKNKANRNNPAVEEKEAKSRQENYNKNAEADKYSKYSKIISESTPEAAAKEYMKSDDYTNFMDKLEKNFKTGKITSYDRIGHNEPSISGNNGYYKLGNELDDIKDEIDEFIESIGNEKFKNIVRKDLYSKIRELGRKYEKEYNKLLEYSQSQFHERDRWDKQRLNNITDPDDPWLVKQVNNMNYDAIQKQMNLRIDKQNKNGVKVEVMTHSSYDDDDDYLEHADRNVKYYQKIELPSGDTRYFYTKEEWDGYQNAKKNAKHAEDERRKQGSVSTEFKMKKSGEALGKAAKNAFGRLANANEYKKNEEYSKYAEEDRQTDMADERERKAVLKKFKKEMLPIPDDMGVEAKKLVDKYIETGDPDDLSALEKALSPELRGNLQGRLLSLQKESFMGNKIRKDGSLRKMSHSFEDDNINTGVMSEYRAFKARANRGAEMNRLSHSSFISPSELNERYEEEIASHCFLAHAGGYGPASGTNAYVAKIDNFYGKGKPRYFYTQEEYDAYQRNAKGSTQAGADRASKETATGVRQNQINNAQKRVAENQRLESQRKNAEAAQNAGADRSEKETGMDITRQKQVADAKKRMADRESLAKTKEQSANQSGRSQEADAQGKGYEEYQKQQKEKLAKERAEIARKNDSGRDAAMKAGQKSEQDRQKLEEAKKNVNKEIDELRNNANDNVYDAKDLSNALKRNLNQDKIDDIGSELGGILTEYYKVLDNNDDSDEGSELKRKAMDEYFNKRDKIFEKYGIKFNSKEYAAALKVSEEIEKEYEKKHKYDSSADAKIKKNIKEQEYNKKNNTVNHSALDELNEFKARVALGKEKNRLAHSRMISLNELQHAASNRYGAASGTNKYYAKLDDFYGKGQPRYFYSKEEWDAYQRNAKGASQAGADRALKESGRDAEIKKAHAIEQERKAAADVRQNQINDAQKRIAQRENYKRNEEAAQGRAREQQAQSYTVKKALEENRRKNEGYAQNAEKDRSNSVISKIRDELKNAPTDIKDAPKPEDKPEITTKVETKVTQETKQENRNIEQEATDYAVNVINAIVEDETVQAYFNNACWHNVFGDSEGQMKEWNQIYDTEIAPRIDATINEAYQLYGPEYAAMLDQQIANLYEQMQLEYTTAYLSQRMALYGY